MPITGRRCGAPDADLRQVPLYFPSRHRRHAFASFLCHFHAGRRVAFAFFLRAISECRRLPACVASSSDGMACRAFSFRRAAPLEMRPRQCRALISIGTPPRLAFPQSLSRHLKSPLSHLIITAIVVVSTKIPARLHRARLSAKKTTAIFYCS